MRIETTFDQEFSCLDDYISPVQFYIADCINKQVEAYENCIAYEISKKIGVEVDKERLIKALKYDEAQWKYGYERGYLAGLAAANKKEDHTDAE